MRLPTDIRLPGLPILPKLLVSFLALSIVPLVVVGYIAHQNLGTTGLKAAKSVDEMGERDLKSAKAIGERAIEDSVHALNLKSTEAIEVRTVELAASIAGFLYERDRDIRILSVLPPDTDTYREIYSTCNKDVIVDGPENPTAPGPAASDKGLLWENPENRQSWRHRGPVDFKKESRPLYKEITFVDLNGKETIKIAGGVISDDLRDVSKPENTYCRAEEYFGHLPSLKKGEIYVSRVVGAYVKGWMQMTPEGIRVKPESAYAGKENPGGRKFDGIVRWAAPVYDRGKRIGYVTAALDHVHLREFTEHVVPTDQRFSALPDAGSGNYAFLWDDRDRNIAHPRHFFIIGFDPETGMEVPGWLSQATYDEFEKSGMSLYEFVERLPSFRGFTQTKKGSIEQMKAGCIGLDCRVLDTAPQCQGWHRGTEDGGSGSFIILWSGLWKFTSYAAVPYFTGMYGRSGRGFGYVTIGANVPDFHREANATKRYIEAAISEKGKAIEADRQNTRSTIQEADRRNRNMLSVVVVLSAFCVVGASVVLSLNITNPIKHLTSGAVAMSRGDLEQHIQVVSRDEIGRLAGAFNEMAAAVAELDRMKSDFVSTASHELRTPIHSMLLAVTGILGGYSGEVGDEVREDLESVEAELGRLTRLVNDLLDLARIEAKRIQLEMVEASPADIVETAVQQVEALLKSHSHRMEVSVPPFAPEIRVDRDRIVQVLINLLSNSIKYSPDGGKIVVRGEARDSEFVFVVADNGYGIPQWAHEKIFEKFFQADSIMSHKVGGSGLGLTISREIVHLHGGSIRCFSPPPNDLFPNLPLGGDRKGTVFEVHLPAAPQKERG